MNSDTLIMIIVSIGLVVILSLYIIAIVHVHRNKRLDLVNRSRWVTLIILFPVAGAIIYFLVGKNPEKSGIFLSRRRKHFYSAGTNAK